MKDLSELAQELAETGKRQQDVRLKCLEIAVGMLGTRQLAEKETIRQFLDQYIRVAKLIELDITGQMRDWPSHS